MGGCVEGTIQPIFVPDTRVLQEATTEATMTAGAPARSSTLRVPCSEALLRRRFVSVIATFFFGFW